MKTAIVIRMHYKPDDTRFDFRLAYFKAMVLPRLLEQTYQDFDICIRANAVHREVLQALHPKIKCFSVKEEADGYIRPEDMHRSKEYFIDFVDWKDVLNMERYEVQIGLDSDDLIIPSYVESVLNKIRMMRNKYGDNATLHLSFQPHLFDTRTLKTYDIGVRYTPQKGSAFFALYQPLSNEKYIFAYQYSHLKLWKYAHASAIMPSGYCFASTHGNNESTSSKNKNEI